MEWRGLGLVSLANTLGLGLYSSPKPALLPISIFSGSSLDSEGISPPAGWRPGVIFLAEVWRLAGEEDREIA